MTTAQILPIVSARAAASAMPKMYVLHRHSQRCATCNATHEWSALYVASGLQTRTGAGKLVTHLTPAARIEYNLPIMMQELEFHHIPFCHACVGSVSLSHLPDPRDTEEWRRSYTANTAPVGTPAKPDAPRRQAKPRLTINDLLDI